MVNIHDVIPTSSRPHTISPSDERRDYLPLYRAIVKADWNKANQIIESDPNAVRAKISSTLETALHIAVGIGKEIDFVEKLLSKMSDDDLANVLDVHGYTALHMAALTGNRAAAKVLLVHQIDLLYAPDSKGNFPIHLAAMSGHRNTVQFLLTQYEENVPHSSYLDGSESAIRLLCNLIDSEMLDLALGLARKYPNLARLKTKDGESALKRISLKSSLFSGGEGKYNFWDQLVSRRKSINEDALKLVKCLCTNMDSLDSNEASEIYVDVVLTAARLGVHEIIEEVVAIFPDALYSENLHTKQNIFHLAVENRCETVYDLSYKISCFKEKFGHLEDSSGNNILHLAGRLSPSHKLNVSGKAFQMQYELNWFKEIQKSVPPDSQEKPNYVGKTPKMIFSEEHGKLKSEGEEWMRDTARLFYTTNGLIIFALLTMVFIVADDINNSTTDSSLLYWREIFSYLSLFSSLASVLTLLSISTSRFTEEDFLMLPGRFLIALSTLRSSAAFFMIAIFMTVFLAMGNGFS